jgi:predicted metal-dependent phosphoesterase TrpH
MSNKHIYVDLHLHTRCSDGVWEPERLFQEVRDRELGAFCVSDHDTLDAYPMPADLSSRSIPGLEVDSHHGGHTAHILAYGVADAASPLLQALHVQRVAREARMAEMVAALNARGIAVSMDDVRTHAPGATSLGRPHLARALVSSGAVTSVQEAFDRYLADDKAAYVALERLDSKQAIALIAQSGGVSIVAHPIRLKQPKHLEELVALGVDGIEVVHPTADAATQRELYSRAAQSDLLVTGGTDFHAPVPDRPIGIQFAAEHMERLRERIAARAPQ